MACNSLLTTSLFKVVNRLDASCCVIHMQACELVTSCFNKLRKVCKRQVATSLILTSLLQLDEINKLIATCQQVGKIDNLQQVCGVRPDWGIKPRILGPVVSKAFRLSTLNGG